MTPPFLFSRRIVLSGTALLGAIPAIARPPGDKVLDGLEAIEARSGGRLGVCYHDLQTGRRLGYRADERFPLCSTFKLLAAGLILHRVDRGRERLDRRIRFGRDALLPYAPVTRLHVDGEGMTVGDLCAAMIELSDNSAANLLLESFGGPAALTGFLRSIGDRVTRLDRTEPGLNEALPGDPRDTTSPAAMVATCARLLTGTSLSDPSRRQLSIWLKACKTGDHRLRAGLPPGWSIGDKTGTGERGTFNDVAIMWRDRRKPVLIAAYLTQSKLEPNASDRIIADVGKALATYL